MRSTRKLARAGAVACLAFVTYTVFTGKFRLPDLIAGVFVAAAVGYLFADFAVSEPGKLVSPARWAKLMLLAARYFTLNQTRAHASVIWRILNPRARLRPAIVKISYSLESEYAIAATAMFITNAPGTAVVDVDEDERVFYVHWIDAKTLDPEEARSSVSKLYEEYCKTVFE